MTVSFECRLEWLLCEDCKINVRRSNVLPPIARRWFLQLSLALQLFQTCCYRHALLLATLEIWPKSPDSGVKEGPGRTCLEGQSFTFIHKGSTVAVRMYMIEGPFQCFLFFFLRGHREKRADVIGSRAAVFKGRRTFFKYDEQLRIKNDHVLETSGVQSARNFARS